jgi:DNA-directed RNA polymerase beta' subunit
MDTSQIFREVDSINFGVLSAAEIIKMSACELLSSTLSGVGSVYDPRMGFSSDNTEKSCVTCNLNYEGCPGHYGHICLPEPVYHPNLKFFKMIGSFLRCVCFKCNNLLISYDQLVVNNIHKFKRNNRFAKILEKLKKDNTCINPDCKISQPKISMDQKDRSIKLSYKTSAKTIEIPLSPRDVYKIFDSISDDNVSTLGFDPRFIHPRNLIITVLPVIPPCSRPAVVTASAICDDDLTTKYIEIIKYIKKYDKKLTEEKSSEDTEKNKILKSIEFHISTLFDNSKGLSKHSTNMKPTSSFRERMSGKNALIRSNLMGKRCNQTARTVIGPDPTLRMGQLAVPIEIAQNLTVPETVTSFNKEFLMKIINDKKANYVIRKDNKKRINLEYALVKHGTKLLYGDVIIRDGNEIKYIGNPFTLKKGDQIRRCGEMIDVEFEQKRSFTIEEGDVVERQLRNGDLVLLNRQPTLHRGSMIAKEVVIKPYKTLRFNLACTKSFNADFDGDEMNIHAGQTLEGRAELMELSASKHNLMSAQSSKPNIVIVQDSLLGAYKMTKGTIKLAKPDFFHIVNNAIKVDGSPMPAKEIMFRINHIRKILKMKGKKAQSFSGKGVFSFTLPLDFNYESKNDADPNEPFVRIFKGVLYEGVINKTDVGSSSNSIIQCLYKEYGKDVTATFIDNVQFLTNSWLSAVGFTVGIKDCLATKTEEINIVVERCFIEASTIAETTHHPGVREARINAALSKARDIGLKAAKESMDKNNNFMSTIMAGSKGDVFNIAQITGLLGQQNIDGQRIPKHLSDGTRTLPHYPFGKLDNDMEYESRGFIRSSFIKGLNPREFYLHAMTGRSGIIDTSTGTARSGYIQRRIVKLTEDIIVKYDGTVRNLDNNVYEFVYADCGLDTSELIVKGGKSMICNVARMVDRMNTECK